MNRLIPTTLSDHHSPLWEVTSSAAGLITVSGHLHYGRHGRNGTAQAPLTPPGRCHFDWGSCGEDKESQQALAGQFLIYQLLYSE
ncbi:hypothetical protein E2C01_023243 [Portunus trituberculatus]|uniref:Uncharacterized protein n=1 Tax=Portunus trituberculatus TaxID=210409 RepID=A0A5B7E990_PORTR|nr:hypothetical protein [Portunus trituberculatus]